MSIAPTPAPRQTLVAPAVFLLAVVWNLVLDQNIILDWHLSAAASDGRCLDFSDQPLANIHVISLSAE